MKLAVAAAAAALATGRPATAAPPRSGALPRQDLPAPFYGQHTGVISLDLNGDGTLDLLFAAGRHWIDQPYALLNLGPELDAAGGFRGVRFSDALPLGPPGGYYQVDAVAPPPPQPGDSTATSTVLLVGGTCHVEKPNDFGSCVRGTNTSATVLEVVVDRGGCSVVTPEAECHLTWNQVWTHPHPRGDRNGGFGHVGLGGPGPSVVLLGQGGVEIFAPPAGGGASYGNVPAYHVTPPAKTDPRSDFARYSAFAAGRLPALGGVVAAGRRSDFDQPPRDAAGNLVGINLLVHEDAAEEFATVLLDPRISGEPYPGNQNYSIQTTNFAFADINGDGIDDLLEGTFLQGPHDDGPRTLVVEGYPLPQRIHYFGVDGEVTSTSVVLEYEHGETGRAVTTGQIFPDSELPDVVFASSTGTVDVFANLGRDAGAGDFRGLELRHTFDVGADDCMLRNLAVAPMARATQDGDGRACWIGIACALTCGLEGQAGRNEIVFVESRGHPCGDAFPRLEAHAGTPARAA